MEAFESILFLFPLGHHIYIIIT